MGIPKVAIVGRPNVGKSSLMNWIAGKLLSIVDPTAGVTRDRVTWIVNQEDRYFELVDTGGIGIVDSDDLSEDIERQIDFGLLESDVLLFVVDAKAGVTPLDQMVGERLRKINKPMLMVVNKCDSQKLDAEAPAFLSLAGVPQIVTSVKGNRNRDKLLAAIVKLLPEALDTENSEGSVLLQTPEMRLAIVGRRNVGKSTFINQLAQEERVIVSEIAGTTRDSIDIRFDVDGHTLVAIDTPGVRKKKSLANDIEFYGLVRALRSIRRADVVLLFFDATRTISKVDKQLVEEITKHNKPCVFVVNKWDLAKEEKMTIDRWAEYLTKTFASMRHVPVAVLTAKDGRNIRQLVNLTQSMFKQSRTRMGTGRLNKALMLAVEKNPPPHRKNKRPKIYYGSQIAIAPPTIAIKCNDPTLFDESWKRYLLGFLREVSPFQEVPIRLIMRSRTDSEGELTDVALRHEMKANAIREDQWDDDDDVDVFEENDGLDDDVETDDIETDDIETDDIETDDIETDDIETDEEQLIE